MNEGDETAHDGLPWPEPYAGLRPVIQQQWGIDNEIYLTQQLSGGKSGAMVFLADVTSKDFAGQAILKFDRAPDPAHQEESEAERHRQAFELAPDYAARHLPRIVHMAHQDESLAILSTIAGRGLEFAVPWSACDHDRQASVARQLSASLLEDWNRDAKLAPGLQSPQSLLRGWLGYRLDPGKGRLFQFLEDSCGLPPQEPCLLFEGSWYPNPLAFALDGAGSIAHLKLRAILGNVHGDLHGLNVLVSKESGAEDRHYLIDLAFFQGRQFLFYDHAYFALSYLLSMRGAAAATRWQSILNELCPFEHIKVKGGLRGDDIGLLDLLRTLRAEVFYWVDRHQANRLSYMESQFQLAQVAVGLNFANKHMADRERRLAFLYAATVLRDYLKLHGVDWPKHGPAFLLEGRPAATSWAAAAAETQAETSGPYPELPEKPAIAVLAFENRSGDPEQDYFADGVADEIIMDLSRVDWLMVISRGASFSYKGQTVDAKKVGKELGVHYVVEGSVRKAGERVRVTAQLVDARSGEQLWAERFDRQIDDIFQLQEEIATAIVGEIDTKLRIAERERARRKGGHVTLWDAFQKGMWHFYRFTEEDTKVAKHQLADLAKQSPGFAGIHAAIALLEVRKVYLGEPDQLAELLVTAHFHATKAVELDEGNSMARVALSRVYSFQGKYDQAIEEAKMALTLNPSSSPGYLNLAAILLWGERGQEALSAIDTSIRLSPKGPLLRMKYLVKGFIFYQLDDYAESEAFARQAAASHILAPFARLLLAAIFVRHGRLEEARAAIAESQALRPQITVSRLGTAWRTLAPRYREKFLSDLAAAGLPD